MITERHQFLHLPLRVSKLQVASVSGWVIWHLKDNGGSIALAHITEMWLRTADGGEVHVLEDELLYPAVRVELEREAISLSNRSRTEDAPIPMSATPYKSAIRPDLDSAAVEGAQQPTTAT